MVSRAWIVGLLGSGCLLGQELLNQELAAARPAAVFGPYIYQIRQELPPSYEMRLPAEVILTAGPGLDPEELIIKLLPSSNPGRLTVGLFTCERSPFPCLVGGFSVEANRSLSAQRELQRHQTQGNPITLAQGVRGYLREGPSLRPVSEFSSLMWEQGGMIYTISFLAAERENILTMGRSMANQPPLRSVQPPNSSPNE
ncbi:hypothetical protein HJG54_22425 [Leptolyngbya sp. NK1-12]|uniref:Uncharacterized protein n=1 Tax=Leptolyngbya sp. NK1-12 TaxID=2547451 RepID=A0AA96WNS0_9CYAN|nr:hypothetical protein [Leptolyngbya sp. NK1-12]WNZ25331.1 hypothetical protein HJG54_22425 [Leptolyngbya sp. NK1-12]